MLRLEQNSPQECEAVVPRLREVLERWSSLMANDVAAFNDVAGPAVLVPGWDG